MLTGIFNSLILASADLSAPQEGVVENAADTAKDAAADTADTVAESASDQLSLIAQYFSGANLQAMVGMAVRILVVLAAALIAYRVVRFLLDRTFRRQEARLDAESAKKMQTVATMTRNLIFYAFLFVAVIAILSILGFDMRGLAASAGVMGVMVAFISQSIIKDWICGIFIIVDHQYNVGDVVGLGSRVGRVKSVTIRTTIIETVAGELVYVPNGSIGEIVNYSRAPIYHYVDVGVAYDADPGRVRQVLTEVADAISARFAASLNKPVEVQGIQELAASSVNYRLAFWCGPWDEYAILRALNEACKRALDQAGIAIPYTTLTLDIAQDKEDQPYAHGSESE